MPTLPLRTRGLKLDSRKKLIIGGVIAVVIILIVLPRFRRATACTLSGGKWQKGNDGYTQVGCFKKSATAGKACTGQLRDECDRTHCDLNVKPPGNAGGGTCPATYVKYFYAEDGQFFVK